MERCGGHGGGVRGWSGVMVIREVFGGIWQGETVDKKCDTHRRDVKGIREVCRLTERCNG